MSKCQMSSRAADINRGNIKKKYWVVKRKLQSQESLKYNETRTVACENPNIIALVMVVFLQKFFLCDTLCIYLASYKNLVVLHNLKCSYLIQSISINQWLSGPNIFFGKTRGLNSTYAQRNSSRNFSLGAELAWEQTIHYLLGRIEHLVHSAEWISLKTMWFSAVPWSTGHLAHSE